MAVPALYAPMTGDSWNRGFTSRAGPSRAAGGYRCGLVMRYAGLLRGDRRPSYRGRAITEEDTATTRTVAVINEAFARRFFRDHNPIGQHFGGGNIKYSGTYEIVGVVNDIRYMTYEYGNPFARCFGLPKHRRFRMTIRECAVVKSRRTTLTRS